MDSDELIKIPVQDKKYQESNVYPGEWFACQHPERPYDSTVAWHDCCAKCLLSVEASIARHELTKLYSTVQFDMNVTIRMSELYNLMRARYEMYGEAPDA